MSALYCPTRDRLKQTVDRYMHERLAERATVLDDKIDEFAELVREFYNLEDIGDPASTSDEELVVVGRICCDEDAKLNEASLVIETSRLMGAGARVPLKINPNVTINGDATVYPLFPGAIVALKGRNETGEWFQVSHILTIPKLLPNEDAQKQERPLAMTVAAGPYTPDSDLLYNPFLSLLEQYNIPPFFSSKRYQIQLGPFVDANHSKISNGDVDVGPLDLFRSRILGPLRILLEQHRGITVLIVPSVTDLLSHHSVFPQPPLPIAQALQSDRIIFLPNPCNFTIDHVRFAVSSVDVLFHLQSQLLRKKVTPEVPAAPMDAMASLAGCVLQQRSFYPLFPAYPADVNLDVSHSEMLRLDNLSPDVLILPSRLKQFHKVRP
ncbi:hypothetical protein M408DRAFT_64337 [Serendipita vermifera MAFF 305830]|uniref:DNA polymerase alpha subunit B n=1 Tax=Serendipita vermifera MAFF 305830 TaxID=933852 RepID=A0A0C3B5A6_SERVB|nr:hypothetical protein M408DRAFT_64337 [Serendipita vermifera MAFF 305830]